jgi:hypothetical protein
MGFRDPFPFSGLGINSEGQNAMGQARLEDLLSVWQRHADDGKVISAKELCRDCPELLPELERRLEPLFR